MLIGSMILLMVLSVVARFTTSSQKYRLRPLALCIAIALSGCSDSAIPATATIPGVTDEVAKSLTLFVIDSRVRGSFETFPVALFKDGSALTDTKALLFPAEIAAHRAQFPNVWTRWRQKDGNIELLRDDGRWEKVNAGNMYPPVGADVLLEGKYEFLQASFSPIGSASLSKSYIFTRDGGISTDGYAIGNTRPAGNSSGIAFAKTTAGPRASYTINGYRFNINRNDGSKEEHVIVLSKDLKYLYIDGDLYAKSDT